MACSPVLRHRSVVRQDISWKGKVEHEQVITKNKLLDIEVPSTAPPQP